MVFFPLEKFGNKHVSFDLKYFETYNKVPQSDDVFHWLVAEFCNLDNEDFQLFYTKTSYIWF